MFLKRLFFAVAALHLLLLPLPAIAQTLKTEDINIRDPYILAERGWYYMYRTSSTRGADGRTVGGVEVFKSKDLVNWEQPVRVLTMPEDNWITGWIWAPEVHEFNGKYYLFATINSHLKWKKSKPGWPAYTFRGTQIFHADSPEGPFKAFSQWPHTPIDWMALDGTLWVEDGVPYMVFCREWVEVADGTMEVVELAPDLSEPAGRPVRLFHASAAEWTPPDQPSYVTDGCFLYRTKTGKLLMIWSSFAEKGYAIGISESVTGKIFGPWQHHPQTIVSEDGGHGMLFKKFDGTLCLVFHQPNNPGGAERARIFEIEDTGDSLRLVRKLNSVLNN